MERRTSLMREVDAILRAPAFQRSPTLSKLLGYLLSREVAGDGRPNQFDIATQALGKDDSFDEQTDSAVRVQMSRLRNALQDYYLTHQPEDGLWIYFRTGDYRLRSASLEVAYPDLAVATSPSPGKGGAVETASIGPSNILLNEQRDTARGGWASFVTRNYGSKLAYSVKRVWKGAIAALVVAGFVVFFSSEPAYEVAAPPVPDTGVEVPLVAVNVEKVDLSGSPEQSQQVLSKIENDLSEILQKSMVSRLANEADDRTTDFRISAEIEALPNDEWDARLVLSDRENRVLAERTVKSANNAMELSQTLSDQLTSIVSPAGQITRALAERVSGDPKNDFECFLVIEGARASGEEARGTLIDCVRRFRDGEFTPYLKIRQAFFEAQEISLSGRGFHSSDRPWRKTSEVLSAHPENPYANTLAAKLLIGRGDCEDALLFGQEGFSRGQTYPALELAIIVDAFGCRPTEQNRSVWRERIARIAKANPDPHTLLESYILLGVLVSEQEGLMAFQKAPAFELGVDEPLEEFNNSLRVALKGRATAADLAVIESTLPALLFSPASQEKVLDRLRQKSSR